METRTIRTPACWPLRYFLLFLVVIACGLLVTSMAVWFVFITRPDLFWWSLMPALPGALVTSLAVEQVRRAGYEAADRNER